MGRDDNFWGPAGKTGPCGPCTEMFFWTGKEKSPAVFDPKDERWVEIWNDVFMEYNKTADGKFEELKQKNVDTGMGLERITAVMQGKDNAFETELFEPILEKIRTVILRSPQATEGSRDSSPAAQNDIIIKAMRIIADHIKASVFILAERLTPSNTERGYVLRRLIRRTVRYGKLLGIKKDCCADLAKEVMKIYQGIYPELSENQDFIFSELAKEEERFSECLEKGLMFFEKLPQKIVSGKSAFDLYQNYGFPIEMTKDLAVSRGLLIDEAGFEGEFKKHQNLSRTASAGQFKSGLADNSEQTTKYHTATHLLLAALRVVLASDIQQKGSNITSERLRFDFSFHRKVSAEEIKNVENIVNQRIQESLLVVCEEKDTKEAINQGAVGVFGAKYGERVKVFTIGCKENVCSKEICAGPHVQNTADLGKFKIVKEEASSSGVRRIKAILE